MNKFYTRVNWENEPNSSTALNEDNLNNMDSAIAELDTRTVSLDTLKAKQSDMLQSIKNVTYNSSTGVFVFTWWNGTTKTVDLNIEKIPVNFYMTEDGVIIMETSDGTEYMADVSEMIKQYVFDSTDSVALSTYIDEDGNNVVTANVVDGGITNEKLAPEVMETVQNYSEEAIEASGIAVEARDDAVTYSSNAQSYAVGGTGTRTGEDTDNAKYYYEQAKSTDIGQVRKDLNSVKSDLSDVLMLGYDVPKACPIQNTSTDTTFTQKVDRVDLSSLNWTMRSSGVFYAPYITGLPFNNSVKTNIYCKGYNSILGEALYGGTKGITVNSTYIDSSNQKVYLCDTSYTSVDALKSGLRTNGVFLYYEITPITKPIDGNEDNTLIKSDLSDLTMLGWEVPKDCPIQNSVSGRTFTQRVGRVDLGSLTWTKSGSLTDAFYSEGPFDYKFATDVKAYVYGYSYVGTKQSTAGLSNNDKSVAMYFNNTSDRNTYIRNSAYNGKTANEFKSLISGTYLYYELATPITKTIDGNEDNVQIKKSLSDNEERGYLENILADNNNLVLGAIAQNNPQSYTSSTNRLVTKDLITLKPNTDYRIRFTGANARFFIIGWTSSSATSATYNSSWQTTDGFTFNSGSCTCCRIGFGKTDDSAITVSNVSKFGFAEYVPSNSEIKTALSEMPKYRGTTVLQATTSNITTYERYTATKNCFASIYVITNSTNANGYYANVNNIEYSRVLVTNVTEQKRETIPLKKGDVLQVGIITNAPSTLNFTIYNEA